MELPVCISVYLQKCTTIGFQCSPAHPTQLLRVYCKQRNNQGVECANGSGQCINQYGLRLAGPRYVLSIDEWSFSKVVSYSISAGCANRTLPCPAQRGQSYCKHFDFYCSRRSRDAPLHWDWPYACSSRGTGQLGLESLRSSPRRRSWDIHVATYALLVLRTSS